MDRIRRLLHIDEWLDIKLSMEISYRIPDVAGHPAFDWYTMAAI